MKSFKTISTRLPCQLPRETLLGTGRSSSHHTDNRHHRINKQTIILWTFNKHIFNGFISHLPSLKYIPCTEKSVIFCPPLYPSQARESWLLLERVETGEWRVIKQSSHCSRPLRGLIVVKGWGMAPLTTHLAAALHRRRHRWRWWVSSW